MKGFVRAAVALTLFVAGACAAAFASGTSPASLLQTTATTGTTGTTGTTATTGTTGTTGTTATTGTTGTTTTPPPPVGKVTICHHTRSKKNPHRTITVNSTALRGHTRHGDTVGACPTARNIRIHSSPAHVKRWHKGTTLRAELKAERKKAKGKKRP